MVLKIPVGKFPVSGPDYHLLRLQGWIENNAADNLWVRKSDLSPHPLNRGEVNLLVNLGH